jgi:hypothetical protein
VTTSQKVAKGKIPKQGLHQRSKISALRRSQKKVSAGALQSRFQKLSVWAFNMSK